MIVSVNLVTQPGTLRPMLALALPVLAEQLLAMLLGLSDMVLAGHYLDQPHLAAMNLMAYVLWLTHGMFAVVAIGATALVARFIGAGNREMARHVVNQALLVGALLALLITTCGSAFVPGAIRLLQMQGSSGDHAISYIRWLLPVIPLVMMQTVGIASLRGAGDMVAGLMVMLVVNTVNVVVSWSLVLGLGPLPELGWNGLAAGTASGYCVGGMLMMSLLGRGRAGLGIGRRWLRPDRRLIRRLLRIGLPGGMDMLALIGCQFWFVSLINQLGVLAAAAHGVAIRIESLAFLPGVAFQMAAATMAGQHLGARDHHRAGRSVLMALLVGGGLMAGAGLLFYTLAPQLALLLIGSGQLEVALHAAPLLRTISLAMPALALTMILSGALRGAGDTRWPLAFTMIGFLGIRLPLAYWLAFDAVQLPGTAVVLAGWGWGVLGAWYAMVADLTVRAALVLYRFHHGGWKLIEV